MVKKSSTHNRSLVYYCAALEISLPAASLIALWIPKLLGYNLESESIDTTSAYAVWVTFIGIAATTIAFLTGIFSGIQLLIKSKNTDKRLITLYTFGPAIVLLLIFLFVNF